MRCASGAGALSVFDRDGIFQNTRTFFAGNFGGGVKWYRSRWGLRADYRLLAVRTGPIALPSEPATPDTSAEPGKPSPRPLAGPVLPLVASSIGTDQS